MKKIIFALSSLTLSILLALSCFASIPMPFNDVKNTDYFYEPVLWAIENDITKGTSDITFSPDEICTRGQMVTFLYRAAGSPKINNTNNVFLDVKNGEYYYNAVLWAKENNITSGTSETTFSPNEIVTRGQTVTFLYRYYEKNGYDAIVSNPFVDTKVGEYYSKAILWALDKNVTTGTDSTHFSPEDSCTRGQIVTFLYRADSKYDTGYPIRSLKINGTDISEFVIAYDNAGGVMTNAAQQMQKYIKLSTGAELDIVTSDNLLPEQKRIYIKNFKVAGLADNYSYVSEEFGITISGDYTRGALYGVFNFLDEQLGWYFYTEDLEVCHGAKEINLKDLTVQYEQFFYNRSTFCDNFINEDISAKLMLNGAIGRDTSAEFGGMDSFTGNFAHTMGYLSETCGGSDPNPCMTDETIYQTTLKNVRALLAGNPNAKLISVSQTDGGKYCQCANCQAVNNKHGGNPSGAIIEFVNRIAKDIKNDYPNVLVHTFAYQYSRKCPTNIVCEDNVVVQLCATDICNKHAYGDLSCEVNKDFREDIVNWSKICKNVYIWDYTINFTYHLCCVPDFDILQSNIQFFYENNVRYLFMQAETVHDTTEFGDLRGYLVSKLIKNPYMTEEEYYGLMDRFMKDFYGYGWTYLKDYLNTIEKISNEQDCWFVSSTPEAIFGSHAYAPYSDYFTELFDKAEYYAGNADQLKRIQNARIHMDWLRLGAIFKEEYSKGGDARNAIKAEAEALYKKVVAIDNIRLGDNIYLKKITMWSLNPRQWGDYDGAYAYKD